MPSRLSPRVARALVVTSVILVSSGCLTAIGIDDSPYSLAGSGGDDDDGSGDDGGNGPRDATAGGGDGSAQGTDGSSPQDGAVSFVVEPCDASATGWHRDCAFGNGGFMSVASDITSGANAPLVTAMDDAGASYFAATSRDQFVTVVVTVSPQGDISAPQLVSVLGSAVALQVQPNGELAELVVTYDTSMTPQDISVQVVDAGNVVNQVHAPDDGGSVPLNFLTTVGSTYTVALLAQANTPVILSFDVSPQMATGFDTSGSIPAAKAIAIDAGAWFIGGSEERFEQASLTEATAQDYAVQDAAPPPFTDIVNIGGLPVAVAPTGVTTGDAGYEIRVLPSAQLLAAVQIPLALPFDDDGGATVSGVSLARGAVDGGDSLAVIALANQGASLYVGHLPLRLDGGTEDGGAPLVFSSPVGDSTISLPTQAVVGSPTLMGGRLYIPLKLPALDSAGVVSTALVLLRLVYAQP